ncbi:MAG: glycosyltransferase [Candidatus Micrarchaeota archaeon]|nr:glycosyltransferase [Candidatus Micrarchaeota archaeon]
MDVTLVGRDFDFSGNDGISRYSNQIYTKISEVSKERKLRLKAVSVIRFSRIRRAIGELDVGNCDLVHLVYPNPIGVMRTLAKMVITWHDNRVFTRAHGVTVLSGKYYRERSVRRLAIENYMKSDGIISVSSKTERELKEYLKRYDLYDQGKRHFVVNEGIEDIFLAQKVWNGPRKDFAYVGSIHQEHKNLPALLRVFSSIVHEVDDQKLHIFTMSPDADKVLRRELGRFENLSMENVVLHYKKPDSELIKYIPKIAAYIHLSKDEGFGLPIMEAISMGTPALILRDSDIPEEVKKPAFKSDIGGIEREALRLLDRQKPAPAAAIKYVRGFTWERTAERTIEVYEHMLK